jgi:hypothetical protein
MARVPDTPATPRIDRCQHCGSELAKRTDQRTQLTLSTETNPRRAFVQTSRQLGREATASCGQRSIYCGTAQGRPAYRVCLAHFSNFCGSSADWSTVSHFCRCFHCTLIAARTANVKHVRSRWNLTAGRSVQSMRVGFRLCLHRIWPRRQ